jgi:serine/threonine protein phosphatase PrpC
VRRSSDHPQPAPRGGARKSFDFSPCFFRLCSDGLSNEVSESAIEQAPPRGGHDNITAVVACAEDSCSPDRTVILPVL